MSRRYQVIGGSGVAFSTGGTTVNVVPKADGVGGLKDSSITDNGTNVQTTEPVIADSGSAGTKAATAIRIGTTDGVNSGLFREAANVWDLAFGGNAYFQFSASPRFIIGMGGTLQFGSGTVESVATDTFFGRRAAASFRLGAADLNGSPVAQTLSVQNAITGSNLPAANTTVDLGLGTGTGLTGAFVVRGGDSSVASGTTAQTNIIRVVLNATKALTSGAATTLVSIPLASLQMTGGYISVYMEATDGTSQATRSEEIYYAGENSAGVFVVSSGVVGTGVTACTATKTLTAAYALTGANPALLQVTPTLTGITATRFTCIYQVHHMGNTQPTV